MGFKIWQTAKRGWRRQGWEGTGKPLLPTCWGIQGKEKHSPAVWLPDWAMPQFMLVPSSSCVLTCWDRLPKSHLRERKGRCNDGSDVSINNLGKLEVLHKHNCELFGRSKHWVLQHQTGWGRKVSYGRWWSLPASSASLSLTLALSFFLPPPPSVLCQEAAQNAPDSMLVPCPFLRYLWAAQFLEALSAI